MRPLVSIIVPTYNRAHYLGGLLDSVLAQSYENWECIIVDDGSTDYTQELLEFYRDTDQRFKIFKRPAHLLAGGNASRNFGFEQSSGDFINWFDDDDVLAVSFIQEKINAFKAETQLVISQFFYTNEHLKSFQLISNEKTETLFRDLVLGKQVIITGAVMFRKVYLEGKPLFSPWILKGQETEFFSRLFYKIYLDDYQIIEKPLFYYRGHEEGKTGLKNLLVKAHLESLAYVYLEILKKGIGINDFDIVEQHYKYSINIVFRSIEKGKSKLALISALKLSKIFWPSYKKLGILLILAVQFSIILGKVSYQMEKYFRHYPINRILQQ